MSTTPSTILRTITRTDTLVIPGGTSPPGMTRQLDTAPSIIYTKT